MSATTLTGTSTHDREVAERLRLPAAAACLLFVVFFTITRSDSIGEVVSMLALAVVTAAVVFGVVVPRGLAHASAGGRALGMAVVGLLLAVPAFWSGLPLLLGAPAALLGYAGRRAEERSGLAVAALVVGLLACAAYVGIYVADWIADPGASWRG